jgi:hypothetical protein
MVMKSSRIFGVVVAVGLLATTAVRAQDSDAAKEVGGAKAATNKSKAPKRAVMPPYGAYVDGPATTDAQGVPVAKPNPLSREEEEGALGGMGDVPGELTDDSNVSDAATSSK